MEFYSIILLCFIFILFYAVEFTSTVSTGAGAFKLIRYSFNETLPCAVPQAADFPARDIIWLVTNDTVKSLQVWPFDFEDDVLWKEFDFGRDYSLIIKKARLHHGGIYTCQIGAKTGNVEAVIFRAHCAFGSQGTNEKLDCEVEHSGPTTPNITWLGGNAERIPGQTYRTPSSTQVISMSITSNGPFECRVSDYRLNQTKTACYRGGRITDKATTATTRLSTIRSTTQATTQTTTQVTTTASTTEASTPIPTTTKVTTTTLESTTTTESILTTIRPVTSAESSSSLSSPTVKPSTTSGIQIQTLATRVLVQNVTTESKFAETDHQVHKSTVTTVTPDADSLMWIIISSFLVFVVSVAIIIALLLIRVRKRQKQQDYIVEKAKEPLSSEVPMGLRYEKETNVRNSPSDPMLIKKTQKDDPV